MVSTKCIVIVLFVCCTTGSLCKPTESNVFKGRGIGSTIWEWVTYPFYWWSSSDDAPASSNSVPNTTTRGPYDNIQVGNRNVTVWCSEHTCTTMRCNKSGCSNITCNIYDTDVNGECRVYNTNINVEDKPITLAPPIDLPTKPDLDIVTEAVKEEEVERPLELEAVLSSTVQGKISSKSELVEKKPEPNRQNKV